MCQLLQEMSRSFCLEPSFRLIGNALSGSLPAKPVVRKARPILPIGGMTGSGEEHVEEVGENDAVVSELVRLMPLLGLRLGTRIRPGVEGDRASIGDSGDGSGGGGAGCVAARRCGWG
jgi:hypothetical protein